MGKTTFLDDILKSFDEYYAYRDFISKIINFFALGIFLFVISKIYAKVTHRSIIKHTVQCAYCRKFISQKVCLR